jgi:DNA-binding Xre family transcriptional regulator
MHHKGEIPDGQVVRHKCDNGLCVNIEHLESGSRQDNINDMNQRGRARGGGSKGANSTSSKIKVEDVVFIRENFDKMTKKALSQKYRISISQIYRINSGERWADISEQPTREQQFLNKASPGPYNEILKSNCLEMPTARQICRYNNLSTSAHRIAYIIEHGSIPDKKFVLHKCDNAKCINHEHLEIGDHEKNMKDRQQRNRTAGGTKHGMCKLSEENARYIKFNPDKKSGVELAKQFNITTANISRIQLGKSWKTLTPAPAAPPNTP